MTCRKSYKIGFLNYKAKWDKSTCSENQIGNKPPMSLADRNRFLLFWVWWIKANQILKYDKIWNKFGRYHITWVHITRYRPIMKSIICIISYNTKESQIGWHKITSYRILRYCTILYNILIHQSIQHCITYPLHMLLYHALWSIILRCIIWYIASESHAIQYDIAPLDTIEYHIIHNIILIIIRWNTTQLNMTHVTMSFYTLQCIIIEIEFKFKSRKFKKRRRLN